MATPHLFLHCYFKFCSRTVKLLLIKTFKIQLPVSFIRYKLPQIQFYLSIASDPTFFRKTWNYIGTSILLLTICDSFVPQLCQTEIDMSRWVGLAL